MPSKDTANFHLTTKTRKELERIREVMSNELGVDINNIRLKHAEIAFRIKASRGNVLQQELQDILIGRIT